jgi:DNA polymerase III epsilon subunit-like protein
MALREGITPIIAYVLDWETGGLSCNECGVTQLSVHAVRLNDFERLGTFMRYIIPYNKRTDKGTAKSKKTLKSKYDDGTTDQLMEYGTEALAVQGATMDMLYEKGIPLDQMVSEWLEWMDKMSEGCGKRATAPLLVGQNIPFDEGFMSQVMEYTGTTAEFKKRFRGNVDFWGNWHPTMVDTIVLGQMAMCHIPDITTYKLEIMAERLGINLVDAHDADADVEATESIFAVLGNRMRADNGAFTGADLKEVEKDKLRKHFKI